MKQNVLEKVKELLNRKEPEQNPFASIDIIDRRIEKSNTCRQCKTLFGKEYENIDIIKGWYNGKVLTQVICKRCGYIHNFINWNNK